ncbi:MAG TPA: methyltransferase domain-containing protein [Roseiarcus sp.]|jgi:SAM-dependent methyltransferase
MPLDVNDLLAFYSSPLGDVSRRLIGRVLRTRWENCAQLSVLSLGYGGPYLERFRDEAQRVLAFMPAEQGVVNWPASGRSASALVEPDMLPLPDCSIDRVLIVHGLETAEHPSAVLEEVWRILNPGGRLMVVTPSRRGVWARVDGTPFGQGQPYSKGQLRDLMRDALFSPLFWGEALYAPPFRRRFFINSAPAIERIGSAFGLPFAGVHIVEATKQVYRPVGVRRVARRQTLALQPGLAPAAHHQPARFSSLSACVDHAFNAPTLPPET